MDLITDLPPTEGSDSILVVVDQGLSKGVILCPTTKMVTMDRISDLLHENLYKRFGLPDKMLSDREPQFAAKAFRAMLSRLGVNSVLSTAYHPQTDRTTERVNQEIEAFIVGNMEKGLGNIGIHSQQSKTCRPTKDIIQNHLGRITESVTVNL
jgi:transposase InsO family protein